MLVEFSDEAKGVRFLDDLLDILRNWVSAIALMYTPRTLESCASHSSIVIPVS